MSENTNPTPRGIAEPGYHRAPVVVLVAWRNAEMLRSLARILSDAREVKAARVGDEILRALRA